MGHISWLMILIYCVKTNISKNTEALLYTSKEVGPEVNKEKTKYIFMSFHQTTG
jgi:hypothetical protein